MVNSSDFSSAQVLRDRLSIFHFRHVTSERCFPDFGLQCRERLYFLFSSVRRVSVGRVANTFCSPLNAFWETNTDKRQLAMSRHLYVFISFHASLEVLNLNSAVSFTGLRSSSVAQWLCDLGSSGFTVLSSGFLICNTSFVVTPSFQAVGWGSNKVTLRRCLEKSTVQSTHNYRAGS